MFLRVIVRRLVAQLRLHRLDVGAAGATITLDQHGPSHLTGDVVEVIREQVNPTEAEFCDENTL